MPVNPVLEKLRQRISYLEEGQRKFSRVIPISDAVDRWLPYGGLPAGCIHEVKGTSLANAIAFSAILSARIAGKTGNVLYIAPGRSLCPLGLLPYGIKPGQILYVSAKRGQDLLWAVMEALRCSQVSSVVALVDGLDLTESRKLQLAAETSGATGFLLSSAAASIASPVTRWKISPVIGERGQRFDEPVWTLDLLYSRGGRPGKWMLEWRGRRLGTISRTIPAQSVQAEREALAG